MLMAMGKKHNCNGDGEDGEHMSRIIFFLISIDYL